MLFSALVQRRRARPLLPHPGLFGRGIGFFGLRLGSRILPCGERADAEVPGGEVLLEDPVGDVDLLQFRFGLLLAVRIVLKPVRMPLSNEVAVGALGLLGGDRCRYPEDGAALVEVVQTSSPSSTVTAWPPSTTRSPRTPTRTTPPRFDA